MIGKNEKKDIMRRCEQELACECNLYVFTTRPKRVMGHQTQCRVYRRYQCIISKKRKATGDETMSKVKKTYDVEGVEILITAWRTSDFNVFSNRERANLHQIELNFDAHYLQDTVLSSGNSADLESLKEWLQRNSKLVIEYCEQYGDDQNNEN